MIITKKDALNLIDALNEWFEVVEPKELEENEKIHTKRNKKTLAFCL
jgi:hypothetical protein